MRRGWLVMGEELAQEMGGRVCGWLILVAAHPQIPSFRGAAEGREPGIHTPQQRMYYVYLTASRKHGTLYLGVTNDLVRRIYEHKTKVVPRFTSRYNVVRLVWFECYDDPTSAIAREKVIKKWRRDWKIRLIEEENPDWLDLYPSIIR